MDVRAHIISMRDHLLPRRPGVTELGIRGALRGKSAFDEIDVLFQVTTRANSAAIVLDSEDKRRAWANTRDRCIGIAIALTLYAVVIPGHLGKQIGATTGIFTLSVGLSLGIYAVVCGLVPWYYQYQWKHTRRIAIRTVAVIFGQLPGDVISATGRYLGGYTDKDWTNIAGPAFRVLNKRQRAQAQQVLCRLIDDNTSSNLTGRELVVCARAAVMPTSSPSTHTSGIQVRS